MKLSHYGTSQRSVVGTQQTLAGASCNGANFGGVPIFSFLAGNPAP